MSWVAKRGLTTDSDALCEIFFVVSWACACSLLLLLTVAKHGNFCEPANPRPLAEPNLKDGPPGCSFGSRAWRHEIRRDRRTQHANLNNARQ